jgi:CheY-like chemotaxis protein
MSCDILLVEDDDDIREVVADILEQNGYRVVPAGDGAEALQKLRAAPEVPRAIFLDLLMPVMDGATFRAEQLRDPKLAAIPVVVMSALADGPTRAAGLQPTEYLAKPIHSHELIAMARKLCSGA